MDIDELKAEWAELDRRLARMEEVVLLGERRYGGVRAELRPLVIGQAIQIVIAALFAIGAGGFWVGHRDNVNLLVTGMLVHVYAVAAIVAAARNLWLAARVDESGTVLALQERIAALRAWRIREGRWFGIVGCFMWVALVNGAFGLLGVDILAANPMYVGFNVLAAVVCLAVFLVVTRLDRAPEGSSVKRAAERLAEVRRFREG